ncbi:MAG: gamma-glutamyl-gamma-aminobutyrate hydrolase family protein [Candidatus Scalindua sp.]
MLNIGISMRVAEQGKGSERVDTIAQSWFWLISEILPDALLIPVPNNLDHVRKLVNRFQINAIILSGGNDWGSVQERDKVEIFLLESVLEHSWPLLGVCRGMQVLNIFFGGRLETHLSNHTICSHAGTNHRVKITGNLNMDCPPYIDVNSYHDQGVIETGVSKELNIIAISDDGIIEGISHPEKQIMGIQWHPERYSTVMNIDRFLITELFSNSQENN